MFEFYSICIFFSKILEFGIKPLNPRIIYNYILAIVLKAHNLYIDKNWYILYLYLNYQAQMVNSSCCWHFTYLLGWGWGGFKLLLTPGNCMGKILQFFWKDFWKQLALVLFLGLRETERDWPKATQLILYVKQTRTLSILVSSLMPLPLYQTDSYTPPQSNNCNINWNISLIPLEGLWFFSHHAV